VNLADQPCIYEVCRLKRREHAYYKPEVQRMVLGRIIRPAPTQPAKVFGYRLGLAHLPPVTPFSQMEVGPRLFPYIYFNGKTPTDYKRARAR